MREVNIVIPADLQNPFDVFDALQSKQFTVIRTPSISSFSNDSQQSLS